VDANEKQPADAESARILLKFDRVINCRIFE